MKVDLIELQCKFRRRMSLAEEMSTLRRAEYLTMKKFATMIS